MFPKGFLLLYFINTFPSAFETVTDCRIKKNKCEKVKECINYLFTCFGGAGDTQSMPKYAQLSVYKVII